MKNASSAALVQALNLIVPLVLMPVVARSTSLENVGTLIICLAISGMSAVIVEYGFNLSATYEIASNKKDLNTINKKICAVYSTKSTVGLLLMTMAVLVSITNIDFGFEKHLFLMAVSSGVVQGFNAYFYFQGVENLSRHLFIELKVKLAYLLIFFALFLFLFDFLSIVFIFVVSLMLANVIRLILSFYCLSSFGLQFVRSDFFNLRIVKSEFKNGYPFFLSRLSVAVYNQAAVLAVSAVGSANAAIYGVSEFVYKLIRNLASPISQAVYPYMAAKEDIRVFYLVVAISGLPISFLCVVAYFFSTEIVVFLYGENFYAAGEVIKIFSIAAVIHFYSVMLGYPLFSQFDINTVSLVNHSVHIACGVFVVGFLSIYLNHKITPVSIARLVLASEIASLFSRFIIYIYVLRRQKYRD